jgi:hypothetical protein
MIPYLGSTLENQDILLRLRSEYLVGLDFRDHAVNGVVVYKSIFVNQGSNCG